MLRVRLSLALAAACVTASAAGAVDLSKIERTISKEPAYKNKPKYGLLAFGEQGKTRV